MFKLDDGTGISLGRTITDPPGRGQASLAFPLSRDGQAVTSGCASPLAFSRWGSCGKPINQTPGAVHCLNDQWQLIQVVSVTPSPLPLLTTR